MTTSATTFADQDAASVDHQIEFSAPALSDPSLIYYGPGADHFYVVPRQVEIPSEEELQRRLDNCIALREEWEAEAYGADW